MLVLERRVFLQLLYDALPDKSRIRLGSKATVISDTFDGVEVQLADGTVERGDMILGCDGVHSMVRESMWAHANKRMPGLINAKEKKSEHSCLSNMAVLRDSLKV